MAARRTICVSTVEELAGSSAFRVLKVFTRPFTTSILDVYCHATSDRALVGSSENGVGPIRTPADFGVDAAANRLRPDGNSAGVAAHSWPAATVFTGGRLGHETYRRREGPRRASALRRKGRLGLSAIHSMGYRPAFCGSEFPSGGASMWGSSTVGGKERVGSSGCTVLVGSTPGKYSIRDSSPRVPETKGMV